LIGGIIVKNWIKEQVRESIEIKQLILERDELLDKIIEISQIIIDAFKNNKKVLLNIVLVKFQNTKNSYFYNESKKNWNYWNCNAKL